VLIPLVLRSVPTCVLKVLVVRQAKRPLVATVIVEVVPKKLDLAATRSGHRPTPANIFAIQQEIPASDRCVRMTTTTTGNWVRARRGESLYPMKMAYQQNNSILARPFIQTILEDVVNPVLLVVVVFHIVARRRRTTFDVPDGIVDDCSECNNITAHSCTQNRPVCLTPATALSCNLINGYFVPEDSVIFTTGAM
jgi:hypothetical protein